VYYKAADLSTLCTLRLPIPVAARCKTWGLRPFACRDCGFESGRGHGFLSVVSVVCCQVEVSVSGRSLVQRSPTECGVSECDREASILRSPWPTVAVAPWKKMYFKIRYNDCLLLAR
jgi:hypothetical protein